MTKFAKSFFQVDEYCFFPLIVPKPLEIAEEWFVLISSLIALFMHFPIVKQAYQLYRHRKNLAYSKRQERERALRTTVTVLFIMLSYFCLVAVPNVIFLLDTTYQLTLPLLVVRTLKGTSKGRTCKVAIRTVPAGTAVLGRTVTFCMVPIDLRPTINLCEKAGYKSPCHFPEEACSRFQNFEGFVASTFEARKLMQVPQDSIKMQSHRIPRLLLTVVTMKG